MRLIKILSGVVLMVAGVFALANPGEAFYTIAFVMGLAMVLAGISAILLYLQMRKTKRIYSLTFSEGLVTLILGLLVLANQLTADAMVPVFFGTWIIVAGVLRITTALELMRPGKNIYKLFLVQGIISILVGIYAFFNTVLGGLLIVTFVGLLFMVQGVNVLLTGVTAHIVNKKNRKSDDE